MAKKYILFILSFILLFSSLNIEVSAANNKKWQAAYKKILQNWRSIEKYGDFSYVKRYWGKEYSFDQYFLCDVNKDGTPELFLTSTKMGLTAVFTYNKKPILLHFDAIYKINKSKKIIVVRGHWHGAGGSWVNEYSIFKVKGKDLKYICYIDKLTNDYETIYTIYTGKDYNKTTKKVYNKYYKKYVKGGKKFSKYKKYKLSNTKGLNKIQ